MNDHDHIDTRALADEIVRYLAAVDVFRAVDCEPTWRPESTSRPALPAQTSVPLANARFAH